MTLTSDKYCTNAYVIADALVLGITDTLRTHAKVCISLWKGRRADDLANPVLSAALFEPEPGS